MGHKICVKPFGKEQTNIFDIHYALFSLALLIIGYVTKDQGQPSYHILAHNVSAQELTNGRREHVAMLSSLDDNMTILNKTINIVNLDIYDYFARKTNNQNIE